MTPPVHRVSELITRRWWKHGSLDPAKVTTRYSPTRSRKVRLSLWAASAATSTTIKDGVTPIARIRSLIAPSQVTISKNSINVSRLYAENDFSGRDLAMSCSLKFPRTSRRKFFPTELSFQRAIPASLQPQQRNINQST